MTSCDETIDGCTEEAQGAFGSESRNFSALSDYSRPAGWLVWLVETRERTGLLAYYYLPTRLLALGSSSISRPLPSLGQDGLFENAFRGCIVIIINIIIIIIIIIKRQGEYRSVNLPRRWRLLLKLQTSPVQLMPWSLLE